MERNDASLEYQYDVFIFGPTTEKHGIYLHWEPMVNLNITTSPGISHRMKWRLTTAAKSLRQHGRLADLMPLALHLFPHSEHSPLVISLIPVAPFSIRVLFLTWVPGNFSSLVLLNPSFPRRPE